MTKPAHCLNLALQGGGAHGAFTWGVLDRLLEEKSIGFSAISGTSAGAMNAVVMADGWTKNGAEGAKEALHDFWQGMASEGSFGPLQSTPFDMLWGNRNFENSPSYVFFDVMTRFASPYDFNPLNINPLRNTIAKMVDFERVHACDAMKLFVSATNVHTGKIKVFTGEELTMDAVMASACLPTVFHAVEIDGVPYWDGGYMGNPPIYPLIYNSDELDVLLVQINPVERLQTPRTARDIMNRMNEITFNSTLLRELRAIEFVKRLRESGELQDDNYKSLRMHRIEATEAFSHLSASSKMNTSWDFLLELHKIGRDGAEKWLSTHKGDIGKKSTFDLRAEFE